MSRESLSKVCCLGSNKQIILLQDFLLGQKVIIVWRNDPGSDLVQIHETILISVSELVKLLSFLYHPVRFLMTLLTLSVHVSDVFININFTIPILVYILQCLGHNDVSHVIS